MNERKLLKTILLGYLYNVFCEIFQQEIQFSKNNFFISEYYAMDRKIIQLFIQGIVETGEYTLEGIAYHTRIPLDVIYDILLGVNNQFSITAFARIINLYMQVKPDIANILIDKLLEIKNKNSAAFKILLDEDK
jgi:uncharacterized protein YutE (UPF0331/DUF86 family)